MRTLVITLMSVLLGSCATPGSGYKRLPERYTAISKSTSRVTFVLEISPAFGEPIGYRFEFSDGVPVNGVKTIYSLRRAPLRTELREEDAARFRSLLLAFDWNHVENAQDPNVVSMVPDDTGIVFRARLRGIYHEAIIGLSNSSAMERLLRDIEVSK